MERARDTKAGVEAASVDHARSIQATDRQLLEEAVALLRRLEPLVDAAERHPFIRGLLRRL